VLESVDMVPVLRLASNSPRRKQLLDLTRIPFSVCPADIDESVLPGELPAQYVLRLAEEKARAVALKEGSGDREQVILAADTTVADGDRILGKPGGPVEACEMLRSLRGRAHTVYTGISVASTTSKRQITELCATQVWMRAYSDDEIEVYITSGDPFDKAGAYAIQNEVFRPVERIEGCYPCVMGLPVCQVVEVLGLFGLEPASPVILTCPEHRAAGTPCPVYEQVLPDQDPSQQGQH